jgi:hypothetical protein
MLRREQAEQEALSKVAQCSRRLTGGRESALAKYDAWQHERGKTGKFSMKANKAMQNEELTRPRACEEGDLQVREASVTLQKLVLRRESCKAKKHAMQRSMRCLHACEAELQACCRCREVMHLIHDVMMHLMHIRHRITCCTCKTYALRCTGLHSGTYRCTQLHNRSGHAPDEVQTRDGEI